MTVWRNLFIGLIIFLPLAIDPSGLRPFGPAKEVVLLIGGTLICTSFVIWRLRARILVAPLSLTEPAAGLLALGGLFWLWSVPVASVQARNVALHWFQGLTHSTLLFVLFSIIVISMSSVPANLGKQWARGLLNAVGLSGLIILAHGLLQAFDLDPLPLIFGANIDAVGRWRIFTTLGNPNWTAEYIAATVPIAAHVAVGWRPSARWQLPASLAIWALGAAVVMATGSRLGMLSLAAAALVWWRFDRFVDSTSVPMSHEQRQMNTWMLYTVSGIGMLLVLIVAIGRWSESGSISGRVALLRASLALIRTSPVTGHGLGHFAMLLPEGLQSFVPLLSDQDRLGLPRTLALHAHNDFLQTAVETGVIGALLLVALFLAGLRLALVTIPKDRSLMGGVERAGSRAMGAALLALLILAIGSFPLQNPSTALLFWVILGLLGGSHLARSRRAPEVSSETAAPHIEPLPPRSKARRAVATAIFTLVGLTLVSLSIRIGGNVLHSNRLILAAAGLYELGQEAEAFDRYTRAIVANPRNHDSLVALASLTRKTGRSQEALVLLDAADQWSSSRESWLERAQTLHDLGQLEAAIVTLEDALKAIPDFLGARVLLGTLYARMGFADAAMEMYMKTLDSPQQSSTAWELKLQAMEGLLLLLDAGDVTSPLNGQESVH